MVRWESIAQWMGGPVCQLKTTLFFFIRTKFIRTSTLRLSKKAKNNFRLQILFVLKFDLCS